MGSDVQISIGAKDTASRALKNVGQSAKRLQGDMGRLGTAAKGLQAAFGPLLAAFAAVKSVQAVASAITGSNEAFLVQEKAARGATEAQKQYASELQRAIGVGDESSLQLMKQAELLGISKEQAAQAATAAIGLSHATGQGLEESLKKVNQVMGGNANALAEVIPGLTKMATEEEKLAAVNALINRGLTEQQAAMGGLEGIQKRATNSWGDLLEVIGQILAPIRAVISQGIAVFAESLQSALVPAVNMAKAAMERLPQILDWVTQAVVGVVTVFDVYYSNLPKIAEAVGAKLKLSWLQLTETFKHYFTEVIPAYAQWFGDNWLNLLRDVFSAGVTIVQNYVQNYADILLRLWEYVASGFSGGAEKLFRDVGDIASRNLLEGFEARTQALPEIMGRQITAEESALQSQISGIATALGEEFNSKFTSRLNAARAVGDFTADIALSGKQAAADALSDAATTGKAAGSTGTLTATESRLQTRGASDDPASKIVKNGEETVKQLREMNRRQAQQKPETETVKLQVVGA